jgi:hypothetical protein
MPLLNEMQGLVEKMKDRADIPDEVRFKVKDEVNGYVRAKAYSLTPDKATVTDTLSYLNKVLNLELTGSVESQWIAHTLMISRTATMGFRLGTAIRNCFQPMFTVYPMLGGKYLGEGITRMGTKEGRALAEEIGLREGEAAPLESALPKKTVPGLRWLHDKSMLMFKYGEYGTRSVAANAGYKAVLGESAAFLEGKMDLQTFKRNTGIVYLEKAYQQQVMQPLVEAFKATDATSLATAVHRTGVEFARNFMEDTHWINRVGNSPSIFRSNVGRLLGQYGVWPLSYVNWIRKGLTTGDPVATMKFAARWLAVNSAVAVVGSKMLGVNLQSWTLVGPLTYGGGPAMSVLNDLILMARGGYMADVGRGALARDAASLTLPGFGLGRDIVRAAGETEDSEIIKRLLGFRSVKP